MKTQRKYTFRTTVIACLIGVIGAAGAATASADTLENFATKTSDGAYCILTNNEGDVTYLYSRADCADEQQRINAEQRREERRDERRDERKRDRLDPMNANKGTERSPSADNDHD
ncbi:hypothetical protein BH93_20210 [Rhodococcoides fascians A25f]|uniref:hypothetical protein n=1 Tax=Rhodococcoides fascians TaxID=1828 RepID=UPI00068A7C33|nr:hypothetical protein [Rhodococcus fascians]QII07385.1 hypothetical protein BH93_20210 [Rhodococcus fascians A25f]